MLLATGELKGGSEAYACEGVIPLAGHKGEADLQRWAHCSGRPSAVWGSHVDESSALKGPYDAFDDVLYI